jgi:hypothetical protein
MDDLLCDLEGAAMSIYAEAGEDPEDPPAPQVLAEHLMGRGRLRYDARLLVGRAAYQRLPDGREWIFVRPKLPAPVEVLAVYHELAERYFFGRERSEQLESWCDQLAYRLRMPHPLFRSLIRNVGPNWRDLSQPFFASQTAGALRFLEVSGQPGVVIDRRSVRARGSEWGWPPESELRRLARARTMPRDITRHRITDRPGAVVLIAA